jgi:Holliday junction resolvase RusA-like endonuclease
MRKEDKLYEQEFGHISNDLLERITQILGKKSINEKFNKEVEIIAKKIKRIKYKKVSFTMWKIVRPSARPRARNIGYIQMYVPRAKEEGDWFEEFAKENNLPFIETPCILNIKVYEKTPSSLSIKNKVLAELGYIRPWKRTGDFDNYAKGIADAIQHGMLKDDCLVVESKVEKWYSTKPRAEIELLYMEKWPEY